MNAIGYVRISQKDQSVYSLGAQESQIREYCSRNNLNIIAVFKDDGECSETFDRPDYIALENFIKQHRGDVQYLIIMDHDRFSRNLSEALAKISQLEKKYGVKVLAVGESVNLDTSDPSVFLNRAFKYLMANHELLNIRRRTARGIRNAMEAGRVVNNAPFGYLNIRDDHGKPTLKIDEAKAPIIVTMFEQFVAGVSIKLIGREAAKRGFSRTGNSALTRVLSNPIYAGLLKIPAYDGKPERFIKALHEPIISPAVYWLAQDILTGKPRLKSTPREDIPLRGVLKCDCGANLTAAYSKGRSKYYLYYQCIKERGRTHNADDVHRSLDKLLQELSFTIEQIQVVTDMGKEELANEIKNKTVLLNAKQVEYKDVVGKMDNLEEKMICNQIEPITYKKWFAKLSSQKANLEIEIAQLKKKDDDLFGKIDVCTAYLTNLKNLYHDLSLEGKHLAINKWFEHGLMYDGTGLRTVKLHPALMHNYLKIKEKGLLHVEQPELFLPEMEGCTA